MIYISNCHNSKKSNSFFLNPDVELYYYANNGELLFSTRVFHDLWFLVEKTCLMTKISSILQSFTYLLKILSWVKNKQLNSKVPTFSFRSQISEPHIKHIVIMHMSLGLFFLAEIFFIGFVFVCYVTNHFYFYFYFDHKSHIWTNWSL